MRVFFVYKVYFVTVKLSYVINQLLYDMCQQYLALYLFCLMERALKLILKLCLFFEIYFLRNYFLNFFIFVYHQKIWSMKNTFQLKKNLALFTGKCFPQKFGRKTLFKSCEKFRNVILFADYIKFGPQTFDCYIYFVLNIYFSISSLKV